MTNDPLLPILADQPADRDQLNFDPYAKTLADIIADPGTDTPLTVGVFGSWGQGKTSLMRMVQRRLGDTAGAPFPVRCVWFNAWLYSHQPALWRALISRVLDGVRGFGTLSDDARADLRQLEARLYGGTAPPGGHLTLPAGALAGLEGAALPPLMALELLRRQATRAGSEGEAAELETAISDVEESQALTRRDQVAALDDFRRQLEQVSRDCIVDHGRLAVFVDDLDRCLPDKAVEVLEAVKLFLDVPGCVFVLGVAREVVEEGIRVRYRDVQGLDGAQYLEKIIQIPFALPPIAPEAVSDYVRRVTEERLPDGRCETVFAVGLEPNPRRIKRTLNIFMLLWRLAQNRDDLRQIIKPVRLAKIVIIQQYHPGLFRLITDGPHYLIDLETRFREQEQRAPEGLARHSPEALEIDQAEQPEPVKGASPELVEGASAGPLNEFLGRGLLRKLLTCTAAAEPDANFADLGPSGVREYVYLTRSSVQVTPESAAGRAESARSFEPQMVSVSAGPFLMGTPESELDAIEKLGWERKYIQREAPQHELTLDAYAIGRYPVTNAEFERFIDDGAYDERDLWTAAGWKQKENDGWTQPRVWEDDQWNDPSQPVVGVSWFEAVAYCRWLASRTGRPYRLPTEAEWEKAARGADGRRYPWGNRWDATLCNNKESGPGRTTPVGEYHGGDSPYGAGELVGQVWEWCSSKYGGRETAPAFGYPFNPDDGREQLEGEDTRILRGGSWGDDNPAAVCRCGYRDGDSPWFWYYYGGFRCARTLS